MYFGYIGLNKADCSNPPLQLLLTSFKCCWVEGPGGHMACIRAPLGLQHGHHARTSVTLPMTVPGPWWPLKRGRSWVSSYGGAQRTPVCWQEGHADPHQHRRPAGVCSLSVYPCGSVSVCSLLMPGTGTHETPSHSLRSPAVRGGRRLSSSLSRPAQNRSASTRSAAQLWARSWLPPSSWPAPGDSVPAAESQELLHLAPGGVIDCPLRSRGRGLRKSVPVIQGRATVLSALH